MISLFWGLILFYCILCKFTLGFLDLRNAKEYIDSRFEKMRKNIENRNREIENYKYTVEVQSTIIQKQQ